MKNRFDAKSVVAGLVLGTIVVASVAAGLPGSGLVGRYQASMADGKALIIDTVTGQAWMDTHHAKVVNDPDFFKTKTSATTR